MKVQTREVGLYGIGSASDMFRPATIPPAVEVLSQGLLGSDPDEIEDIWQSAYIEFFVAQQRHYEVPRRALTLLNGPSRILVGAELERCSCIKAEATFDVEGGQSRVSA